MSARAIFIILITIAATFLNCSHKEPHSAPYDEDAVIKEVHDMLDEYFAAIRKSGLRAEFDYLDPSSDFFWVPPGINSAISYDSVKTILESNADTLKEVEFYWETLRIVPLSKNIASYTGIVKGRTTNALGDISQVNMIETGTVVRRESGWKILSGQSRNLD